MQVAIPEVSENVANPALCEFVENPAIVATPAMLAKVAIPEKSENVANPALCDSTASIEVDIVPVVNPVIITSFPIKTESLNLDKKITFFFLSHSTYGKVMLSLSSLISLTNNLF